MGRQIVYKLKLMYQKTPILKKIKKKIIYFLTKIFLRTVDRFFNTSIEEIIRRNLLNLHSQRYKILKNKYYFIHVPKTGGTTFHHHLQVNLKKQLFNFNHPYNYNYYTHFPLKKNHPFKKDNKYFTIIRNPLYRVYSFYVDCLSNKKNVFHNVAKRGIKNFCFKCWEAQNLYTKYYSGDLFDVNINSLSEAKKNLSNFFFLLDFDYLDNDIIKISSKLNFPSKQFEIKNTKKYNSPSLSDLNVIKKYNEFDTQLYDYFKKEIKI